MRYEIAHCPICGCPFDRKVGQRPRVTCSSECRAEYVRIRREGYIYKYGSTARTVLEACRAYAERTGLPLRTAQRAWGLE